MRPEERARKNIDRLLQHCGWVVQDYKNFNIKQQLGVAIKEFPLGKDHVDYALSVDGKMVGVLESKPSRKINICTLIEMIYKKYIIFYSTNEMEYIQSTNFSVCEQTFEKKTED